MSIYYIATDNGNIYELDATLSVTYEETGTSTDNTIEDGSVSSDHYINNPSKIMFEGVISDIKSASSDNANAKDTGRYIDEILLLKKNKQTFSFHFGDKIGVVRNCLFDSISFSQNKNRNSVGGIDSFDVSCSIKQIRKSKQAKAIPFRNPLAKDAFQEKQKGKGSAKEEEEDAGSITAIERWIRSD